MKTIICGDQCQTARVFKQVDLWQLTNITRNVVKYSVATVKERLQC